MVKVSTAGSFSRNCVRIETPARRRSDRATARNQPMTRSVERGAVNAHTHIYSGLAPLGMPPPLNRPRNFLEILKNVWWRLDRALDAESLRAAARYYVAESLLSGTSTLIDHHESPNFINGSLDILADACSELGIRALICYGATERNGGRDEARRGLAECRRFVVSNRRPGIVGAVALHASFTVSDETVRDAGELCRALKTVMHVHVAEDRADGDDAIRRGYRDPLERLFALGALPTGSLLAHGVHLGVASMRRASEARLWIVQNPRSNRGNGVGYPVALRYASRVALGTDGYPSRMEDEIEALHHEASARGEEDEDVQKRIDGGEALARELFGDATHEVTREKGRVVAMRIGDRSVVENGKLVNGDIEEIHAYAHEQAARLWKRMAENG